mmetsp:Transcript_20771/g.58891  ORF Transcript_20771/g.58891 Transcript_20771/m.58891 type:complete len:191 (+) Transcript_20771:92-664(+)
MELPSGIIALVVLGLATTSAWFCAFCLLRSCVTSGGRARLAALSTTAGLVAITFWVWALMDLTVRFDIGAVTFPIAIVACCVGWYAATSPVTGGGVHAARFYRCFGPFSFFLVSAGYIACIYLDRTHISSVLPCYDGAAAVLWAFAAVLAARSGNALAIELDGKGRTDGPSVGAEGSSESESQDADSAES